MAPARWLWNRQRREPLGVTREGGGGFSGRCGDLPGNGNYLERIPMDSKHNKPNRLAFPRSAEWAACRKPGRHWNAKNYSTWWRALKEIGAI